jgi:putative sigma-54 modulation protein
VVTQTISAQIHNGRGLNIMRVTVSGKNLNITQALNERVEKKCGKLNKFFKPETEVLVTLSIEKSRHIVEVTIPFNGVLIRAEESSQDMYTSIDKTFDKIERQIKKNRMRLRKRIHESSLNTSFFNESHDNESEEEFKIVRTKKFALKPMTVEEAILQMNLLGHEFFMFLNAETDRENVVYKRKDGDYGLIEPDF